MSSDFGKPKPGQLPKFSKSKAYSFAPQDFDPEKQYIFWGPNQQILIDDKYVGIKDWHPSILLKVPRIGRMVSDAHVYAFDPDESPGDRPGDNPPTGPGWKLVNTVVVNGTSEAFYASLVLAGMHQPYAYFGQSFKADGTPIIINGKPVYNSSASTGKYNADAAYGKNNYSNTHQGHSDMTDWNLSVQIWQIAGDGAVGFLGDKVYEGSASGANAFNLHAWTLTVYYYQKSGVVNFYTTSSWSSN